MGDIFICHSQRDYDLVIFMNEICANAGVHVKEFEFNFEAMDKTANEEIVKIMKGCSALFVLLGRNMNYSIHTSNWVSAEVGLARGLNIPICVVEDRPNPINFPIPFVDHYLRINVGGLANRDPEDHKLMQEIVKTYGNHQVRKDDITIPGTTYVGCGQVHCQAMFYVTQPMKDIEKCPVCGVYQPFTDVSTNISPRVFRGSQV